MNRKLLLSANFKRDYVAASAVVIFALIVAAELTLAVAIPTYLHRENAMAIEVRRLKLLESFDNARRTCNSLKPKLPAADMELQLVAWNLDRLAVYLREESRNLDSDEIARLQEAVNDSWAVLNMIRRGASFSKETTLDTGIYVNSLIPKNQGASLQNKDKGTANKDLKNKDNGPKNKDAGQKKQKGKGHKNKGKGRKNKGKGPKNKDNSPKTKANKS